MLLYSNIEPTGRLGLKVASARACFSFLSPSMIARDAPGIFNFKRFLLSCSDGGIFPNNLVLSSSVAKRKISYNCFGLEAKLAFILSISWRNACSSSGNRNR